MELGKEKLVSVIVLSYQSRATISRALHSIFMQDYSRIEVIVSDDGSEDFSVEYIDQLVSYARGSNVERVEILTSCENEGTVSNLWKALRVIRGEYFMVIGADDVLAQKTTITSFISTFSYRNWKPLLVTGLAEMWSEDMNTLARTIPERNGRSVLQKEDPDALLNALAYECVIPIIATCFHKSFIERVNAFDCSYRYYEDYPTFIRMASRGIVPVYVGKVMVRHAAGGAANGSTSKEVAAGLFADRQRMWKVELKPYFGRLTKESRRLHGERRQWEKKEYRKSKGMKRRRFKSMYDIKCVLERFFTTKAIHRSMQSFRFTVLLLLFCAVSGCLGGSWGILSAVFVFLSIVSAVCFAWFVGFGGFRLVKRALAGRRSRQAFADRTGASKG